MGRLYRLADRVVETHLLKDRLDDRQRTVYLHLRHRLAAQAEALAELDRLAELEAQKRAHDLRLLRTVELEATYHRRLARAANSLPLPTVRVLPERKVLGTA